ncbi:hypothetical protein Ga0123462_0236 [Mariprofundus ferrinatatus]|uniref:Uncharacterized protein n=1 Tax=Mariprofundus ferrinatatus TaxID=1921087 RepID=A0A2K8L1Z5_9PROT|nr:hypothetical protein [Mariprofundus ferrinatatus]ATX81112.1 hypothetical protein Ga0123462_0236 [Mariprofundus ferrinatatus]
MLDYAVIPVPGFKSVDLHGIHLLHQMNSWLYLGLGLHAPLLHGNYGGFMVFDVTAHAQQALIGNSFVNAGISLGGGGGGPSIRRSAELTGTGGFIKGYMGIGYDFRNFSVGVNYAHYQFKNSRINSSQLNMFVQKKLSYSIGSYAASGTKTEHDPSHLEEGGENMLTIELNNIFQIKPKGSYTKPINSLSLQFSHFLTNNHYVFFAAEGGYYGMPLYNHILGGVGYRHSVSPRVSLYGQIGVGSGGYSPDRIDTGPGLLVHPKFSIEYFLNNNYGLSLSSGYLFAPKGSSNNFTLGAAINFHLSNKGSGNRSPDAKQNLLYSGIRIHVFQQTEFGVRIGNIRHPDLKMLSTQFDYLLNENWYIPTQVSFAYNSYFGTPGYGEALTGLGIQTGYSTTNSLQGFFQVLIGASAEGVVLKPSVGLNYELSDHYALYGQLAKTISLEKINLYPDRKRFRASSVGIGLTYRFSTLSAL